MEQNEKISRANTEKCKICGSIFIKRFYNQCYCCKKCNKIAAANYYKRYCQEHRNAAVRDLTENSSEGYDYIICPICGKMFSQINMTHLKTHNYANKEQFFHDYPNFKMTCEKNINENLKGSSNPNSKYNATELKRKQTSPWSLQHYLKKYDDEDIAKCELNNFLNKYRNAAWHNSSSLEHIVNALSISEEEAKNVQKKRYGNNSLKHYTEKYGKEEGSKLYTQRIDNWCKKIFKGQSRSKIADRCIQEIIGNNSEHLLYGSNEFATVSPITGKLIRCDLTNIANKTIIEFFGDFWHCNPIKYDKNYVHPKIKKTAKEIWEKDENRIKALQQLGYTVLIIWEYDFKHNHERTLEKAKKFIFEN